MIACVKGFSVWSHGRRGMALWPWRPIVLWEGCLVALGASVDQSVLHGEGSLPSANVTTHVRAGGSRVWVWYDIPTGRRPREQT